MPAGINDMSVDAHEPVAAVRETLFIYLRLAASAERDAADLVDTTLARLAGDSASPAGIAAARVWPVFSEVLKEAGQVPDARFQALFDASARRPLQRTPMGYRPFDHLVPFKHDVRHLVRLFWRRMSFFSLVIASTAAAASAMTLILSPQAFSPFSPWIICVFTFLFGWISVNFWTVIFGFAISLRGQDDHLPIPAALAPIPEGCQTAIIMPVHHEDVKRIYAALQAMHESLAEAGVLDHFDFFILSDSAQPGQQVDEETGWARLCQKVNGFGKIFYRRRKLHIHKKSGNVTDFCRRWGAGYKYMLTLDADSLMGGELLVRLVNMMEARSDIGILQTAPMAMNQTSLVSRMQQFSGHVYGPISFAGLRFWQLDESGFWGHNAIVRMEPFMRYCVLPKLSGGPPFGGHILSHDFVEAALMRRAGFGVWLAHELKDSYEELPPNLLEELERDRRWCQGNIQHLRLMFMKNIALGHRILFLNGNLFYFSSFMWFSLLILMTSNAIVNFFHKTVYFSAAWSLFPRWPVEYRELSIHLLIVTAVFLFTPKVLSLLLIVLSPEKLARFGGFWRLLGSVLLETFFSVFLAPIRMIFHTWYVVLNLSGQKLMWKRQVRDLKKTSVGEAFRAHWTGSLGALVWAVVAYAVNETLFWWVSLIAVPLILAVPISVLFSYPSIGLFFRKIGFFLTPPEIEPSRVLSRFQELFYGKDER
ncbi:MAG: glucans biosynthesis glucosyltransferase MdoH [Candidatus Omnitrophota bacterium]